MLITIIFIKIFDRYGPCYRKRLAIETLVLLHPSTATSFPLHQLIFCLLNMEKLVQQ